MGIIGLIAKLFVAIFYKCQQVYTWNILQSAQGVIKGPLLTLKGRI